MGNKLRPGWKLYIRSEHTGPSLSLEDIGQKRWALHVGQRQREGVFLCYTSMNASGGGSSFQKKSGDVIYWVTRPGWKLSSPGYPIKKYCKELEFELLKPDVLNRVRQLKLSLLKFILCKDELFTRPI